MTGSKSPLFGQRLAWQRDVDGVGPKRTSLRYLTQFVRLKCAPDLLALRLYPNAKEVTETVGAFSALRQWPGAPEFGQPWKAYVVGDGVTPRTGAFIAMMSRWSVVSIDPNLKDTPRWEGVRRLQAYKIGVEHCALNPGEAGTAIVAVHSHAKDLKAVWNRIPGRKVCVAIPCCFEQTIGRDPDCEYEDWGIHSPHRTVRVWWTP